MELLNESRLCILEEFISSRDKIDVFWGVNVKFDCVFVYIFGVKSEFIVNENNEDV